MWRGITGACRWDDWFKGVGITEQWGRYIGTMGSVYRYHWVGISGPEFLKNIIKKYV